MGSAHRYVAIIGNSDAIDSFVSGKPLALVREYPSRFYDERPKDYFTGPLPQELKIKLYEVTELAAGPVLSQLKNQILTTAGSNNPLAGEISDLEWLSYMPGEVLLGDEVGGAKIIALLDRAGLLSLVERKGRRCNLIFGRRGPRRRHIRVYDTGGRQVRDVLEAIRAVWADPNVTAEEADRAVRQVYVSPNYVTASAQGYIAGSPFGMKKGAPTPPVVLGQLSPPERNVWVGVFDTMPQSMAGIVDMPGFAAGLNTIPFDLPAQLPMGGQFVPGHGTVIAHLIKRRAPTANAFLVRVMNETAVGRTSDLLKAMLKFIRRVREVDRAADVHSRIVFNLSLVIQLGNPQKNGLVDWVLDGLTRAGVTIVAAAGNDSAYSDHPEFMPLPAAHQKVIGVAATTLAGQIACYSNAGDVAAFGGGVARDYESEQPVACKPTAGESANASDQEMAAKFMAGWDPTSASTQFSWSMGTSFAAPIVAGVVADFIATAPMLPTPTEIRHYLEGVAQPNNDPNLSVGIIV
ncbi:MAG: S8/S53 family peptidase [Chloroflexota bacterium]